MTLEEIRQQIDEIDSQLLPLFMKRMNCAEQVAEIKRESNLPVYNPEREQKILDRVEQEAGKYGIEARMLYSGLMDMSRAKQHSLLSAGETLRRQIETADTFPQKHGIIACLGDNGSFSHEAVTRLYPGAKPEFFDKFSDIFAAVETGKADLGIVPVENSSTGSVSEVYDLILKYRFHIIAASTLRVHDCVAGAVAEDVGKIKTVYSHPQALAQCSEFIRTHGINPIKFTSTAGAAQMVSQWKESGIAAICSEAAAREYGLHVLQREVQNSANNCTRFIVISRDLVIPPDAQKISLCFSLLHKTGSLYNVLVRFAAAGLNLTKIESRPIINQNFEYDFYLDFTGNVHDERTLNLILALYDELPRFSFLGNYTEQE